MPAQLKRLIPLFIIFVGLFLIVRYFLVPDSFGQYGHYRGESLKDNASKEVVFASREQCYDCHEDMQEKLENDVHSDLSCLTCHGPGLAHVTDPIEAKISKESGREFCGRCHDMNAARPIDVVLQVDIKTHHTEKQDCIECHNPHQVWEGLE
ncbi:MAG: cytochrome c3 family protein [Bacteroidota bacterium]